MVRPCQADPVAVHVDLQVHLTAVITQIDGPGVALGFPPGVSRLSAAIDQFQPGPAVCAFERAFRKADEIGRVPVRVSVCGPAQSADHKDQGGSYKQIS